MKQARAIEHLDLAGWRVHRMLLPCGAKYHAIVTGARARDDIGYIAVWLSGHIVGRNLTTGEDLQPRKPWSISTDLAPLSVGRLEFEAVEDTEWLCFDAKINNGVRPVVTLSINGAEPPAGCIVYPLADGVCLHIKSRFA